MENCEFKIMSENCKKIMLTFLYAMLVYKLALDIIYKVLRTNCKRSVYPT